MHKKIRHNDKMTQKKRNTIFAMLFSRGVIHKKDSSFITIDITPDRCNYISVLRKGCVFEALFCAFA